MAKPEWTRLIHVAKNELKLTDEKYRSILAGVGVESSTQIHTPDQFDKLMAMMANLGFKKKPATRRPKWEDDWWRCSAAQRAKIEVLWAAVARNPTDTALRRMVARIIHIDNPAWISPSQASKVIVALRAMAIQAGIDPDKAVRPKTTEAAP